MPPIILWLDGHEGAPEGWAGKLPQLAQASVSTCYLLVDWMQQGGRGLRT